MKKWNKNSCCLGNGILILLAMIMAGCASPFSVGYGAHRQSRDEFARYVEDVFRLQNRMTSEVMMLLPADEAGSSHDDLLRAEHQMHEVCASLNEYAVRESEGQSIGLFLSRNLEKSAADCEQAALRVQALLLKQNDSAGGALGR